MTRSSYSREVRAALPWLGAAVLWFAGLDPLRAAQGERLGQQSQIRRDHLKAERAIHDVQVLRERVTTLLASACRGTSDPASLRQRAIAATAGLSLSPLTLSVAGNPAAGATVDAEGTRPNVLELLKRLGDPAQGGFLRTATLRLKGGRWGMSSMTGVLENFQPVLTRAPAACAESTGPAPVERSLAPAKAPAKKPVVQMPTTIVPTPEITPMVETPPFTVVGFLMSEGRTRVSLRVGDQVRVISAGDMVSGWRCVSIDRDEGAVFTSASGARVALKGFSSGS